MPDLADRRQHEATLTAAILLLLREWRSRWQAGLWSLTDFRDQLQAAVARPLEAIYVAAGMQVARAMNAGIGQGVMDALGRRWAIDYSRALAAEMAATTAERIADARQAIDDGDLALSQAADIIFGEARAENAGITEVTRGITAGESEVIRQLGGEPKVLTTWKTEADARVCEVCWPLDGQPLSVYRRVSPSGPPAHPRCRCWLEYEVEGTNA